MSSGIRIIVPDLPGHDRSAGTPYVSHKQTVEQLTAIIEEAPSERASIVGFSLGAQLAVTLASIRPDLVDGVLAISAQANPFRFPRLIVGLAGLTAGLGKLDWFGKLQAREHHVPQHLLGDYIRTSKTLERQSLLAILDENIRFVVPTNWSRLSRPALIIVGAKEHGFMLDSARLLHRIAPNSELKIVEGCGHSIPFERSEWLAQQIVRLALTTPKTALSRKPN